MSGDANSQNVPPKGSNSLNSENKFDEFNKQSSQQQQTSKTKIKGVPKVQRVTQTNNTNDGSADVEDPEDPCKKKKEVEVEIVEKLGRSPGLDPRFQQQNQTLRCFVMYTDFYRCEKILGNGHEACTWFRDVYTAICPNAWISRWDEFREEGRLPWSRGRTQGDFPGDRYGV